MDRIIGAFRSEGAKMTRTLFFGSSGPPGWFRFQKYPDILHTIGVIFYSRYIVLLLLALFYHWARLFIN